MLLAVFSIEGAATEQNVQDAHLRAIMFAAAPDLLKRLQRLEKAEHDYRLVHDSNGAGHIETGRAWDRLRKEGDAARSAIAKATGDIE